MVELSLRDAKVKCKKFRREGLTTGLLIKKNGERIPISMKSNKINKIIYSNGSKENLKIKFEGEELEVRIVETFRNVYTRIVDNIDLQEV